MKVWRIGLRGLARQWRSGELRVLAVALVVAVAAVSAVSFFTDRIARVMSHQAAELLAADLVVESGDGIRPAWAGRAEGLGLRHTRTADFRSMLQGARGMELVEVKAAADGYPLRGVVKVSRRPYGPERTVTRPPEPGRAWMDPRLLQVLGVQVGDTVQLGDRRLRVSRVLRFEPDRGGQLFNIAPRVMINYADLERTGLIGVGSLVDYRLLLAGEDAGVARYRSWIDERIGRGDRVLGVRDARPELRLALDRAGRFLGLAALVSVVLAGVAVGISARQYARRQLDGAAVMRCLGASRGLILGAYLIRTLLLGLAASALGLALGFAAQSGLAALVGHLFARSLPLPAWTAVFQGLAIGLVLLIGFAVPPLLALGRVPPLRVLRHEAGPSNPGGRVLYGAAVAAVAGLTLWYARDVRLALYVLAGTAGAVSVLAAAAWFLVAAVGRARGRAGAAWRFGVANIARRPASSVVQIVAFGVGLMALLLLALVRGDLLAQWQERVPPDAPNRFLIDIQADQIDPVGAFFRERNLPSPPLYPMVKGRLVAIDGEPVDASDYENGRAKRLVNREFNLSWAERVRPDNRVIAGRFWTGDADGGQWSVEKGIAETLGIEPGSVLRFRIGGREVSGEVTSLRAVEWDSFRVNFFVLGTPEMLSGFAASYITSFHLPADRGQLLNDLVERFPNVTVIDVEAVMSRVRSIIERVSMAVEFVFGFTLAAGLVVLFAAIQSTREEREREAAVLRALGASRRQLLTGTVAEFAVLGVAAGLLAAFAATAVGYGLAVHLFDLDFRFNPVLWLWGVIGGGLGIGVAGTLGVRRIVSTPPMRVLQG